MSERDDGADDGTAARAVVMGWYLSVADTCECIQYTVNLLKNMDNKDSGRYKTGQNHEKSQADEASTMSPNR